MTVQGGYTLNHGIAYAGMLADLEVSNTVSRLNKTGAVINYGRFVTADGFDSIKLPSASTDVIVGVTRRQLDQATPVNDVFAIQDEQEAGVVTLGSIWVEATEAFAVGDLVAVVTTAGDDQGKASVAADATSALVGATVVNYNADKSLVQISLKIGG